MTSPTPTDTLKQALVALETCDPVDATDPDGWYCENHPERLMGHDGCGGAGVPEFARIHMLLGKLRRAKQETRETAMMRDELAAHVRRLTASLQSHLAAPPDTTGRVEVGAVPAPLIQQDEQYRRAVAIVMESGRASVSMVQRKLNIRYSEAQELIVRMLRDGLVGIEDTPGVPAEVAWAASPASSVGGVGSELGDGAERRVEAAIEKLRQCKLGCGPFGQCKAAMHGVPSECAAPASPAPAGGAHWRCICGVTAMPLTDDTTCNCADIYEQQWTRVEAPTPAGPSEPVAWADAGGLARLAQAREGYAESPLLTVHAVETPLFSVPLFAAAPSVVQGDGAVGGVEAACGDLECWADEICDEGKCAVAAGKVTRGVAAAQPQRCDDCANRGPWRAEYSKVPIGPQGVAVADCPHAYPGTAVTPGSGSHCPKFTPRNPAVQGDGQAVPGVGGGVAGDGAGEGL